MKKCSISVIDKTDDHHQDQQCIPVDQTSVYAHHLCFTMPYVLCNSLLLNCLVANIGNQQTEEWKKPFQQKVGKCSAAGKYCIQVTVIMKDLTVANKAPENYTRKGDQKTENHPNPWIDLMRNSIHTEVTNETLHSEIFS